MGTSSRCVVGLFAHPDDEAYAAAGTLARCAERGARVVVVSATRGEAGNDRRGRVPAGPELAALRTAELERSCGAMRAEPPVLLDLPDGAVSVDEGAPLLARLLDELDPDVVITLGPDGAYGHRDHLATTAMLAQVARDRRVLHAAFPRGCFEDLRRRLSRFTDLADVGALGIAREEADLVVDITPYRQTKLAALAAHRSQLADPEDPHSFLIPDLVDPLLAEEWFVCAQGPPLPTEATTVFAGLPEGPR